MANGLQVSITVDGGKTWSVNPSIFPPESSDKRITAIRWISPSELMAGGDTGTLCSLAIADGQAKLRWSIKLSPYVGEVDALDDKCVVALSDRLFAVDRSTGKIVATSEKTAAYASRVRVGKSCVYVFGSAGLQAFAWDSGKFGAPRQLAKSPVVAVFANHEPLIAIGSGKNGEGSMLVEKDGAWTEQTFLLSDDGDATPEDFAALSAWERKMDGDIGQQLYALALDQDGMTRHQQFLWAIELMKQRIGHAATR